MSKTKASIFLFCTFLLMCCSFAHAADKKGKQPPAKEPRFSALGLRMGMTEKEVRAAFEASGAKVIVETEAEGGTVLIYDAPVSGPPRCMPFVFIYHGSLWKFTCDLGYAVEDAETPPDISARSALFDFYRLITEISGVYGEPQSRTDGCGIETMAEMDAPYGLIGKSLIVDGCQVRLVFDRGDTSIVVLLSGYWTQDDGGGTISASVIYVDTKINNIINANSANDGF